MKSRIIRTLAILGFAGAIAAQSGCTTNAATGRSQLNLLSRSQEIAMGEGAMPQLTGEYGGKIANEDVSKYVRSIGNKMTRHTEADNPGLPWEFTVLDSDVINAFALPGGKVFISKALAVKLTSEAQLASILGHEIGHVTAQHVDERMTRQYSLAFGGALIGVAAQASESELGALGGQLLIGGAGVYALSFDRNQESESDALGIRYMTRAGYNPIGSLQAMQVLADEAGSAGGGLQDWFSTHPHPATRVGQIRGILEAEFPEALADTESNTFADRYRRRLLDPLGAVGDAGAGHEPIVAATEMPRGRRGVRAAPRLGVLNIPTGTHAAGDSATPSAHNVLWCLLCQKQQDEEVRDAITGEGD